MEPLLTILSIILVAVISVVGLRFLSEAIDALIDGLLRVIFGGVVVSIIYVVATHLIG